MRRRLLSSLRSVKGFTMIELLVVIAIIGVLAVAVLASINPIEQINKGRDTRLRSNASQLLAAVERYYTTSELYPWNDAAVGGGVGGSDTTEDLVFPDALTGPCTLTSTLNTSVFCQIGGVGFTDIATNVPWVQGLADTNEIKDTFLVQLGRTGANDGLYLVKPVDGELSVCFQPSSQQFRLEAVRMCADNTSPAGKCDPAVTYTDATQWTTELICLP